MENKTVTFRLSTEDLSALDKIRAALQVGSISNISRSKAIRTLIRESLEYYVKP